MTTKNIYIIGQGYSPTPVSVAVSIDGTTVYNGSVPTVDQSITVSQASNKLELQQQLEINKTAIFSIERDVLFTGQETVNIQVTGGPIWFGTVLSNYMPDSRINPNLTIEQQAIVNDPASTNEQLTQVRAAIANPPFTAEEIATIQSASIPFTPEIVALIDGHNAQLRYRSSGPTGFQPFQETGTRFNPWSSVAINGAPQPINPDAYDPPLTGSWWWVLNSGDSFQGTLYIPTGINTP